MSGAAHGPWPEAARRTPIASADDARGTPSLPRHHSEVTLRLNETDVAAIRATSVLCDQFGQ